MKLIRPQIVRYLEAYHSVSNWAASNGKMTDISLSDMTMSCDAGTFKTPFKPPMSSLREARDRVVEMDKECVQKLGRSDITIKEYRFPTRPFDIFLTVNIIFAFVMFSSKKNFAPDSIVGSLLPEAVRAFCVSISAPAFYSILGAHVCEVIYNRKARLGKYNVNPRSGAYWMWTISNFLDGFPTMMRCVWLESWSTIG